MIPVVVVFLILSAVCVPAQKKQSAGPRVTKLRLEKQGIYGPLFVTIAGSEKRVTDKAQQAWIINSGRHVVYSSSDGAGGYENEGQSLHLYDVATGKHKRIMSEYFMVEKVEEAVTSNKKRALLIEMADGGLGASYVAVVDPWRGEVFFRRWARILARKGDTVVIGFYKEEDWEKLASEQSGEVRPYKSERHNLKSLLLRRVIFNKRDN
jgi:type I site-specific restriction endonuclease